MLWIIFLAVSIVVLAWAIRKAVRGTPFAHKCPCTPYIEHLRPVEDKDSKKAKENLW